MSAEFKLLNLNLSIWTYWDKFQKILQENEFVGVSVLNHKHAIVFYK